MYRFVYNTLGGVECCQVQLIWTDGLCCVRVLLQGQSRAGLRGGSPSSLPTPLQTTEFPSRSEPSPALQPSALQPLPPLSWAGARRLQQSWRPLPDRWLTCLGWCQLFQQPCGAQHWAPKGCGLKGRWCWPSRVRIHGDPVPLCRAEQAQREAELPAPALPSPGMADAGASGLPERCRRGQELALRCCLVCQHPDRAVSIPTELLSQSELGCTRTPWGLPGACSPLPARTSSWLCLAALLPASRCRALSLYPASSP